jgi:hypothetical protein
LLPALAKTGLTGEELRFDNERAFVAGGDSMLSAELAERGVAIDSELIRLA